MEIVVCIKRVPDTAEAEVTITEDKKDIKKEGLAFEINEWDNYAVEEAVQLKEKFGGNITVVSVGSAESNDIIRRALAMGADRGILLRDEAFDGSDSYAIAKILHGAIKDIKFDLVLTGAQAGDDGCAQVGPTLAELLGIPHATLVTNIEIEDGKAKVRRELEGGLEELLEIELPALFGIQTGINEPRYVSIMGIRKARKKEIVEMGLKDIGLTGDEVGLAGSKTIIEELFIPPVGEGAEIIEGDAAEVSARLAEILKEKGVLA
ncbi:MAG: electron transfer flavoprotein subunit beta/FixA family protein [Candidatus Syntropharchaeia archaeon]